ncbi:GcrA family cell cycle regulator [Methylobacterium nodulans]|uniref:GcrA cell cycle regulator n=1 Tax=Methylobacterium nodulans (strain LMG 21967 / CNCM I-2342 / ORS 2060) TaxID=460265 RepID=B8IEK2_METNO|nr:GcrA family cell cycle regulator [Methylobacterium nodulans]ACL59574.1 GcrA cell cycle regulator [Methylobacterium nodulans ORS 2060]
MAMSTWTDERIEELKRLWSESLTGSEIAKRLGLKDRNAVMGKIHRLGLARKNFATEVQAPANDSKPAEPEEPLHPILLLKEWSCRFPVGDPLGREFRFCCAKRQPGLPYCEAHARIAYTPMERSARAARR